MAETTYDVRDNPEAERFEVTVDGHLAIAEYRLTDKTILFSHTEVPAALEGRGVGSALVRAGLKSARSRGLLVLPVCTFFAGYLKRHPEEHDLVHPDYRTALGI
jgi:predicted GNAT family acetyltransferase